MSPEGHCLQPPGPECQRFLLQGEHARTIGAEGTGSTAPFRAQRRGVIGLVAGGPFSGISTLEAP